MPIEKPTIEGSRQLLINLYDSIPEPDDLTNLEVLGELVFVLNDHFHLFVRDYYILSQEAKNG